MGPAMGMDKTVQLLSSLTAWVRELREQGVVSGEWEVGDRETERRRDRERKGLREKPF
jgi:hypothetical protein